ncbi:MAG: alpha-N-acetylglucosaminidase [Bacteroidaceae bacterium]|nr:alpha-N-acetylglucosaminidase [Bacteroidaceae bacterium]
MKKTFLLSFLLALLGTVSVWAENVVTGSGAQGTINISDINDQNLTSIPANTGWTLALEVENPDGNSFNQWGTSILAIGDKAFPEKNNYKGFQLYLQSSTNGGKLDAVFDGGDHLIDNVTYTGNFSAVITYNGSKQLQIKTTNASEKVAINDYTLTNALGEFSQLAYGLPTGINVKNLQIAPLSNSIDYPTVGNVSNNKYTFTSDKILYAGDCNKIRFTLTESGAFYQGGAKRMSFDSFTLYNANGNAVTLKESYFSGNNGKTYAGMLDGENNTYTNAAWASGTEDDYFEITLPEDIDLGGAFSFSFVTENTTMNAKAFRIEMLYEAKNDVIYTFAVNAPEGHNPTITYNGEDVSAETTFTKGEFDIDLFSASEISGYTWSIVVDEENYTITLVYTEAPSVENPAAVVALVNRIGGEGTADKFKFLLDPSLNSKQEVFVIGGEDGKVLVKGSTLSAITTGLGWYLNHIAKINIAWNSLNEKTVSGEAYADLSNIPVPTAEETHISDAKYRYYLNTCTFGYSMTSWTWKRWQQEIDWMALHGINMPLQLVGLEEVWRKFLTMEEGGTRKYGYTDAEAKAFVAGPAFIAWWAMNNLEGWGGTATGSKSGYYNLAGAGGVQDEAWYVRQKNLAKQITDRQRELGMQPVLPGWSGMVPTNFASESGYATRGNGGNWAGDFVRPLLLSVSNDNYAEIAADYYACLKEVMGESQYYSMDPFHEGGGAGTMEDYEALYAAMEAAKPGSQWVIQQWQWSATQKYSLTAVPAGRLVVLDLFSDGSPAFDKYNGYAPQDAVFCAIPNFGGRSGLMGRLQNVTDNYFKFKGKYASIKGIGAAPEAIEQTPVTYDLIFQLPWMNGVKPDVKEWVGNYAVARYGKDNAVVKEAWDLLRQGPLNYGADGIQGPVEDVWAARPNLDANAASAWGSTISKGHNIPAPGNTYTPARRQMLIDAVYKLIDQKDELELTTGSVHESNYLYDIVEFGGAVMADYAHDLLLSIKEAKNADNTELYEARRNAFLQLILDVDKFKGTNLNFRLGKWTQEARDAAGEVTGATTATPDWYEYNNARTIVSTWSSPGTNLNDYSYRSWQGLMKDLYYPRWKHYFDNNCTTAEYQFFEWNWAHGMKHSVGQTDVSNEPLAKGEAGHTDSYTREPEGNTVEKAKEILDKYIIPVNNGAYYAYRYLNNDLTGKVTIIANAGTSIDLTQYFDGLTGAVSGDFINGTATDLSSVAIKSDAADGSHTGALTLTDGTVLTFAVVINPGYYGVYNINYKNGDEENAVFVGYNEDKDNSSNVGYKLIATGTYSTDDTADKMFTIVPNGTGFSISAQGKYLKQPTLGGWNHLMFSDNADEAGAYIIEETGTDTGIFKIRSTTDGINYLNDYDKLVFGNDKSDKDNLATFTITEATSYPLTITEAGFATLCLPFNVVMPEGMYAYDLSVENIASGDAEGKYNATMKVVATSGEALKKGTPVIIKANEGSYRLPITMSDNGAKTSLAGSLLRGNFTKQELVQGDAIKKYIFAKPEGEELGFYLMDGSGTIGANKCWMEWTVPAGQAEARSFVISFDDATGISDIITETKENKTHLIYNISGQRLNKPQKGLNIIGNKKVIIK